MSDDHRSPDDPLRDMERRLQALFRGGGMPPPAAAAEPGDAEDETDAEEAALQQIRDFSFKPREIRDYLDRFVIKQDEAKKVLSVAICDHYNHARRCLERPELLEQEYTKQNIILLGPTGVGKTYLMRCIARLIGVPFVKADATKFSETGYVGHDVEEIVRDLVRIADGAVGLAQFGIIYIDEIDKIASRHGVGGRDVSGRGVQTNLLKLMEDSEVSLHSQTDLLGQMEAMMDMMHGGGTRPRTINTRHILFIVSGAFDGLDELISRRLKGTAIGFGHAGSGRRSPGEVLGHVQTTDLIGYGFEPEFVGRLPVRVACDELSADDLEQILLHSEGSILGQYQADFAGYDIALEMGREAVRKVAETAASEGTGARGLMTVLEKALREFKFELPSTSIRSLALDAAAIEAPDTSLRELLAQHAHRQRDVLAEDVAQFAARFAAAYGLTLTFTDEAVAALIDQSLDSGKTMRALCEGRFRDFQFGLQLVARNTGRRSFEISREAVMSPDQTLSQWVVESYVGSATEAAAATPPAADGDEPSGG